MNAGLKRIEATLHDLGNRGTASTAETGDSTTKRPFSFRISVGANEPTESTQIPSSQDEKLVELGKETESDYSSEQNFFPHHDSVQTFQAEENGSKTPSLPKLKTPSFSSHRHGANPALAMNLLQEIQETVADWQTELQNILKQIQDIYLEGPIVNGWLESNPTEPEAGGTATLRHAEVDRLMNYVEEICATGGKVSYQSSITGYRLCGVDDTGKVWSRPCPPDQVPNVSMAIARYQKLRQLLGRKQSLETRLSQLAQTLVVLHSHIQQT
ncbi:hypothetical protein [Nostoc sp. 'Lobaria pulmonaria (5183) cyanobiont']|uniref:hypothetical protein n=1 Tax=Nostoc sp. 'Lobaria pulmonaria (5183) cyanobiont' TaxID=1618022 RepID=UPI000CF3055A|nr:hypothetical protein [Nostoc sp. 'Lobaria pulmonaria (5183) cyanobiont']AVH72413.1 hypothetical protein NLP_3908 [Nostoc sp. 'Lobaria pulmonaria (5183) cyanobiont']